MIRTILNKTQCRLSFSVLCCAACLTFASLPAVAQGNVDARLSRIENELDTLSRALFKGETPPAGSLATGSNYSASANANTELRLQQIEMELRNLTGRAEEQAYETDRYKDRTEQMLIDLESRIGALEARINVMASNPPSSLTGTPLAPNTINGANNANGYPPQANSAPTSPAPYYGGLNDNVDMTGGFDTMASEQPPPQPVMTQPGNDGQLGTLRQPADQPVPEGAEVVGIEPALGAPVLAGSPAEMYDRAFSYLRQRDYDNAEQVFTSFLTQYSDHDLAANAKYWLGETFYVRNNYDRAAREFAEAYQKYPKGPKGPDNLLKLGMSLAGLEKTDDACVTLKQLHKEYPDSPAPVLSRAEQEMEKLGCQKY